MSADQIGQLCVAAMSGADLDTVTVLESGSQASGPAEVTESLVG